MVLRMTPLLLPVGFLSGFLENDMEWMSCLNEAALVASAAQLRQLFATILVFCNPGDIKTLFDANLGGFSEDFYDLPEDQVLNQYVYKYQNAFLNWANNIRTFRDYQNLMIKMLMIQTISLWKSNLISSNQIGT